MIGYVSIYGTNVGTNTTSTTSMEAVWLSGLQAEFSKVVAPVLCVAKAWPKCQKAMYLRICAISSSTIVYLTKSVSASLISVAACEPEPAR